MTKCPFGPCETRIVDEDPVSHYVLDRNGERQGFVFLTIEHYQELLKGASSQMPQANPITTSRSTAVTPEARKRFLELLASAEARGFASYGKPLETFNGRSAKLDAAEEIIDLWQYMVQDALESSYAEACCQDALSLALELLRAWAINPLTGACQACGEILKAGNNHKQNCRLAHVVHKISEALDVITARRRGYD